MIHILCFMIHDSFYYSLYYSRGFSDSIVLFDIAFYYSKNMLFYLGTSHKLREGVEHLFKILNKNMLAPYTSFCAVENVIESEIPRSRNPPVGGGIHPLLKKHRKAPPLVGDWKRTVFRKPPSFPQSSKLRVRILKF